MRKIPLKNYFILSAIIFFSVLIVLYFLNLYMNTRKHYNNITTIPDFVKEVKPSELSNYVTENPNFIIYLSHKNNSNDAEFEKKLKKLLTSYDLQKQFIFINLDEFEISKYNEFIADYYDKENLNLKQYDNIIIIDNQKITDILYEEETKINIDDVKQFLKENEAY